MRVAVLPGVLRPPSDCRLLASVVRERRLAPDASVLDVFTGTGALAVAAALDGARDVTAVDISRRAVVNVRLNAILNRVRVRTVRGDVFAPVAGERFDLILANPPYLPSGAVPGGAGGPGELPSRGLARAWEGGVDGRTFLDRLCAEARDHLTPGGRLLLVQSSLAGEHPTLERLAASGLRAEIIARRRGPLGPIAAARASTLERQGLLDPGEREEELLVISGRTPMGAAGFEPATSRV